MQTFDLIQSKLDEIASRFSLTKCTAQKTKRQSFNDSIKWFFCILRKKISQHLFLKVFFWRWSFYASADRKLKNLSNAFVERKKLQKFCRIMFGYLVLLFCFRIWEERLKCTEMHFKKVCVNLFFFTSALEWNYISNFKSTKLRKMWKWEPRSS